jgi:hypothetical protein
MHSEDDAPQADRLPPTGTEALRRAADALDAGDVPKADAWMRLADRLPG